MGEQLRAGRGVSVLGLYHPHIHCTGKHVGDDGVLQRKGGKPREMEVERQDPRRRRG